MPPAIHSTITAIGGRRDLLQLVRIALQRRAATARG